MRRVHTALIAGAAAVAVAGLAGAAAAKSPAVHLLRIALPGGGVEAIRYTGDVAPRIYFAPAPLSIAAMFGPGSPFAALDRISAEMDREAASMLQQTRMLMNAPPQQLNAAALANLPAGSHGYYFAATMSGNGVCSESMTIASQGNGAPPRVVRRLSGNCGAAGGASGAVGFPSAPAPRNAPRLMQASAPGARVAWER